ncbi:MAG: DUF3276 family protein [Bacteroidota bacterium]
MEPQYKDEIFTRRVRAGKRTYFFDVKSTKSEKDFYITITESKRVGEDEYEKHKIFLYKEDFRKFLDALDETVDHIQNELLPSVKEPAEETTETEKPWITIEQQPQTPD